ncbi:hypothetical protein QE375_001627 [Microbacterium foliorum]|uniref:Uncharacterized protein n=1 Tax=Microbacterium foliorum TaxID=104336 RepID=A0ABU1HR12_9MICO|nr:hypothetical protein [Microbacterium foliorum]MDR6142073.1 hypothetical protein [Microbacterium foliorum]
MPTEQITDDTPNPADLPAIPASMHMLRSDERSVLPTSRTFWPLAPWRTILLVVALMFAMVCGIAAAEPVWNGADLGVGIAILLFVAAFMPGSDS